VTYRITADERARFKRCRRQWDFASPHRRDLEPVTAVESTAVEGTATGSALRTAVKDALAVYYYPGTWDWPHELTQSLVHKGVLRSLSDQGAADLLDSAVAILDCYDSWSGILDDFAPVRIDHDVDAMVPNRHEPGCGMSTADGEPVVYAARVDLLAVDAADEYWVVRHVIADEWLDVDSLLLDEQAVAACWAWEQDYIGMAIAGTVHNEIRLTGPLDLPTEPAPDARRRVAQHEPSGGGRSIPQHRRAGGPTPASGTRIDVHTAGPVRRTRIRRSPEEIASAGAQLADEAVDMIGDPLVYPAPAAHCRWCEFSRPCVAMTAYQEAEPLLISGFRRHPDESERKPRLGQATWGFGRGAAPPRWQ
jgi:hypothetical protein